MKQLIYRFKRNRLAVFGICVLITSVFIAILASLIAPYDPTTINLNEELMPPSFKHLLGTDNYGRDILSRLIFGARISLSIGFIAVSISIIIGICLGAFSGYFGGIVDSIIMRITDIFLCLPTIFLILTIQVMLKPNIYNVMVVIGLTSWMGVARLVRGEFLSLREYQFVEAAHAIGASNARIIFRHILPNAVSPIIVSATLGMADAILAESVLSFVGLGVQPPFASWGNMLENAQGYMQYAPWMAISPGILILLTVLSLNFVGEGFREVINSKE